MDFFEADFHLNPGPALRAVAQVHAQIQKTLRNNNLNLNVNRRGGGGGGGGGGGRPNQFGNFAQGVNRGIAPLGRITSNISEFNKSLDAANARVLAFGASTGVIFAVSKATKSLVSDFIEVEKKLASIQVILQATKSDFSAFSKELFKIASATGQSFDTAAEAAGEFSRQGLTLTKTLEATTAALTLTRLTGLDAAKSVEALTAIVNTFNKEGLTYTQVVDKLASVDAAFAVSSADLAEAIKRVGSSAVDAGVSLDELNAAVAAVKQVTGREGSVIGNSFKTIFARIQRSDVQSSLNSIGIATKEANGEFRNAIDVLRDLSVTLDSISDQESADIIEKVAGVRQINILRAMVTTLKGASVEASLFGTGLDASANSLNAASLRNSELNQTTSALLNTTKNAVTEFNSLAGKITFEPFIRQLASETTGLFSSLSALLSQEEGFETAGGDLAKGILKGFSNILSGPGFIVASAIIFKTFFKLTKDFVGSVNTLFRDTSTQAAQLSTIFNNLSAERKNQITSADTLLQRQRLMNQAVAEELVLRRNGRALIDQSAAALPRHLVRGLKGGGGLPGGFAGGFIPALSKEKEQINAGVGGARRSAKPKIISANIGRGTEKIVVNTDEYVVDNFNGTGLSAVLTRDMARKLGGITGVNRMGDVRNFAPGVIPDPAQFLIDGAGKDVTQVKNIGKATLNSIRDYEKAVKRATRETQRLGLDDAKFRTRLQIIREEILTRQEELANLSTNDLLQQTGKNANARYGRGSRNLVPKEINRRVANERLVESEQDRLAHRQRREEQRARAQRNRRARENTAAANTNNFNQALLDSDTRRGGLRNVFGAFGGSRRSDARITGIAGRAGLQADNPLVQQSILDARNRASTTRRNVAFGASFGVPLVGGILSQQLGGEQTKVGRFTNEVAGAAGLAGLAASLGPLGAAVGVSWLAFKTLNAYLAETGVDLNALRSKLQAEGEQRQKNLQESQNFIAAQTELTNLISDGASEQRILQAQKSRDDAFFGISNRGTRDEFINAGTDLERAKITQRAQEDSNSADAFAAFLLSAEESFKNALFKNENFLKTDRSAEVRALSSQFKLKEGVAPEEALKTLNNLGGGTLVDLGDDLKKILSGDEAIKLLKDISDRFESEGQSAQFGSISDELERLFKERLEDLIKLGDKDEPEKKKLQDLGAVINNLKVVLANRETRQSIFDIGTRGSEDRLIKSAESELANLPDSQRVSGQFEIERSKTISAALGDVSKNDNDFKSTLKDLAGGIEDRGKKQEVLSLFDEDNPDLDKIREKIIESSAIQEDVRSSIDQADQRRVSENAKIAELSKQTVETLKLGLQTDLQQLAQLKVNNKAEQTFTPEQSGKDLEARAKAAFLLTPENTRKTIKEAKAFESGLSRSQSEKSGNLASQAQAFAAAASASIEGFNANLLPVDRPTDDPKTRAATQKRLREEVNKLERAKIISALGAQASTVPAVISSLGGAIDTATKGRSPGFRENNLGGKSNLQKNIDLLNEAAITSDTGRFSKAASGIDADLQNIINKAPKGEGQRDIIAAAEQARALLRTFLVDSIEGLVSPNLDGTGSARQFAIDKVGFNPEADLTATNAVTRNANTNEATVSLQGAAFEKFEKLSRDKLNDSVKQQAENELERLKVTEERLRKEKEDGPDVSKEFEEIKQAKNLLGIGGFKAGSSPDSDLVRNAFKESGGIKGAGKFGDKIGGVASFFGGNEEERKGRQDLLIKESLNSLFDAGASLKQIKTFFEGVSQFGFSPEVATPISNNVNRFAGELPASRTEEDLKNVKAIPDEELDKKIKANQDAQAKVIEKLDKIDLTTAAVFSDNALVALETAITRSFAKSQPIPPESLNAMRGSAESINKAAGSLGDTVVALNDVKNSFDKFQEKPVTVIKNLNETLTVNINSPESGLPEEAKAELLLGMEDVARKVLDRHLKSLGQPPSKIPPQANTAIG